MVIKERKPLPMRCRFFCKEIRKAKGNSGAACSECDYALNRFVLLDDEGKEIEL
jgi:hypothetical protein